MTYRIEIDRPARKALDALDGSVHSRVVAAILGLADDPRPSGCTKMTGRAAWHNRIGDYRVVYEIHDRVLVVMVVEVGHRREVYR